MKGYFTIAFALIFLAGLINGASLEIRLRRDVVDTAKSLYNTVSLGTKAVFNDMIGNNHVAVESYRQAKDESQKIGPAFTGIFVNPNKSPAAPSGPPARPGDGWSA